MAKKHRHLNKFYTTIHCVIFGTRSVPTQSSCFPPINSQPDQFQSVKLSPEFIPNRSFSTQIYSNTFNYNLINSHPEKFQPKPIAIGSFPFISTRVNSHPINFNLNILQVDQFLFKLISTNHFPPKSILSV